jgi:hypothetical protein
MLTAPHRGLMLAAGLCAVAMLALVAEWTMRIAGGPAVEVVRPSAGSEVGFRGVVEGTVTGLQDGQSVWVFVTDQDDQVYHPQVGPAALASAGVWGLLGYQSWRVVGVRFGYDEQSGRGKRYYLSTAVADAVATQVLRQYLADGERAGAFAGLRELPAGAHIQGRVIEVSR